MAVRGFFSDTRLTLSQSESVTAVPYVRGLVYLPVLDRRAAVDFLIDTGADTSVLHPQDSLRLLTVDEIKALPNAVAFGGAVEGSPTTRSMPFSRSFMTMDGFTPCVERCTWPNLHTTKWSNHFSVETRSNTS